MLRVTALYPNVDGSRFDAAYYTGSHTALARSLLGPHGLIDIRITLGIAAIDGSVPPFWSVSEMIFASEESFANAMAAEGQQLMADAEKYTDVSPILQISTLADNPA